MLPAFLNLQGAVSIASQGPTQLTYANIGIIRICQSHQSDKCTVINQRNRLSFTLKPSYWSRTVKDPSDISLGFTDRKI